MQITKNNQEIWKALFKAAEEFRDFKPWKHFDDSLLFGVQDPESGEIGWCVIMGAAGQVYGLAVYLGDEGFRGYEEIIHSFETDHDGSIAMNQKYLKVEFVGKNEMDDGELKALNQLGLKYKGRNQYINVRRMDPHLYPWYVEDDQVEFLTHCLNQALRVVQKTLNGEVEITELDDEVLLVMVPEMKDGNMGWRATYLDAPEIDYEDEYIPDTFLVNRLKRELKKKDSVLFFSFQYMMKPVQDHEGNRPYIPRVGYWVDGNSGLVIDFEIFPPENFWKRFQSKLVDIFKKLECIPATIGVDSDMSMEVMELYSDELSIDLVFAPDHPLFKEVKDSFGDYF